MIKSILRPKYIFASLGTLIVGAFIYFSYFPYSGEIYINQAASANSSWLGSLAQLGADAITEKISPAQDLGEQPNITDALLSSLTNTLGPRVMQEGGLSGISPTDIQSAAQYLPKADAILPPQVKVSIADIKISEQNSPEAVKEYFENIMSVYEKTFHTVKEDDLMIALNAFETNNFTQFSKMDFVTAAFENSFNELKKIPVPKGYEQFLIRELELIYRSKQVVEKVSLSAKDPLAVLILLTKRVELMQELNEFHEETGNKLKSQGIIFIQSDKAFKLFN